MKSEGSGNDTGVYYNELLSRIAQELDKCQEQITEKQENVSFSTPNTRLLTFTCNMQKFKPVFFFFCKKKREKNTKLNRKKGSEPTELCTLPCRAEWLKCRPRSSNLLVLPGRRGAAACETGKTQCLWCGFPLKWSKKTSVWSDTGFFCMLWKLLKHFPSK